MKSLYDGLPEDGPVRVVGRLESLGTLTERVNRLQARMDRSAGQPCYPKGVFKFKTYEEADAWMKKIRRSRIPAEAQTATTSSGSVVS